jgi:hypothetical protein
MPPEEFFSGTTQAGRTLVLYYEHTMFDTFVDEAGETFDNPSETKITGTLDGAPIDVQAVEWSGGTATVLSNDLGTFGNEHRLRTGSLRGAASLLGAPAL